MKACYDKSSAASALPRVQDLLQSCYSYHKVNKGVNTCGRWDNVPVLAGASVRGVFVVLVPGLTADVNLKIEGLR